MFRNVLWNFVLPNFQFSIFQNFSDSDSDSELMEDAAWSACLKLSQRKNEDSDPEPQWSGSDKDFEEIEIGQPSPPPR